MKLSPKILKGLKSSFNLKMINHVGNGKFLFNRRVQLSHRFAYQIWVGSIPINLCICHHCDNPSCVNPKHLFLGTVNDNNQDKVKKGRQFKPQGTKNWKCILTNNLVIEIREKYTTGKYSYN